MLINADYHSFIKDKNKNRPPIEVAVLGAGWFGQGLIYELARNPYMQPRIIFNRTADHAIDALIKAGIKKEDIEIATSAHELKEKTKHKKFVVCSNLGLINQLPKQIDVFFDANGSTLTSAEAAYAVIQQKRHFITTSAEMDATVGLELKKLADTHGIIYSNSEGDQPGCLAKMVEDIKLMGFDIAAAGNGKGFLNYHATPDDILQYVPHNNTPQKITSFTDGTKQSLEITVLANGLNLKIDKRGMHGTTVTKENLVDTVMRAASQEGIAEYIMGENINLGMTIFVIGKRNDSYIYDDLAYLRIGKGPYYLFFKDYHLCYLESPKSILGAVLFNKATIAAQYANADVITVAKRDLHPGEKIDGIGGYMVYGLIDTYDNVRSGHYLPLGLSEYTTVQKHIKKDSPITFNDVDIPDNNLLFQLKNKEYTNQKPPIPKTAELKLKRMDAAHKNEGPIHV